MSKSVVVKSKDGYVAINNHGETVNITEKAAVTEIEKLVADRQRVGREISGVLKRSGMDALGDEPTEVIEPNGT